MRSFLLRLGVVPLLAFAGGGAASAAKERYLPPGAVLPGLRIDGATVLSGSAVDVRAFVTARALALESRKMQLAMPGEPGQPPRVVAERSLKELGVSVDVDQVTARALAMGHDGDYLGRAQIA